MSGDEIKDFIKGKQIVDFVTEEQDFRHGLKLVLRDTETGELGLLAVEPDFVVLPEESLLFYSYQLINQHLPEPPIECLILDLKTRLEPDFEKGETPSLFQ